MARTFIPNPRFPRSEVAARALEPKARAVAERASELAARRTGHLAGGVTTELVELDGRWVFRIIDTDFKARWLEFGTVFHDAEPFLGPAALEVVGNLH